MKGRNKEVETGRKISITIKKIFILAEVCLPSRTLYKAEFKRDEQRYLVKKTVTTKRLWCHMTFHCL
jgi:hypothetical protein